MTPADKPDLPEGYPNAEGSDYLGRLLEYTAGDMQRYGDAREAWARTDERRKALEEAAQVCIDHSERCDDNREFSTAITCSRKIRALLDRKEPTT